MRLAAILAAALLAVAAAPAVPSDPDLYAEKKAQAEMKLKMKKMAERDGNVPPSGAEAPQEIPLTKKAKSVGPPKASSHVWQRVAHESCKHLAYGEKCGEFTTEHADDFENFKVKIATKEGKHLFGSPVEFCHHVAEAFASLPDFSPPADAKEQKTLDKYVDKFCSSHYDKMYSHAKTAHIAFAKQGEL